MINIAMQWLSSTVHFFYILHIIAISDTKRQTSVNEIRLKCIIFCLNNPRIIFWEIVFFLLTKRI